MGIESEHENAKHNVGIESEKPSLVQKKSRNKMNFQKLIELAVKVAETIAAETETEVDDKIVDVMKLLLQSGVLRGWIEGSVSTPPGTLGVVESPSLPVQNEILALGFGFDAFIELIPRIKQILDLIRMFSK